MKNLFNTWIIPLIGIAIAIFATSIVINRFNKPVEKIIGTGLSEINNYQLEIYGSYDTIINCRYSYIIKADSILIRNDTIFLKDRSKFVVINEKSNNISRYDLNYYRCIENLMLSEDFNPECYSDPSGHETIGFGHRIKNGEPKKVTFTQAYTQLKSDFNGCVHLAEEMGYSDNKALAVAHAIYCLGVGIVNDIKSFKRDIMKYCYFRDKRTGKFVLSEHLKNSREFELNLFNENL